LRKRDYEYGCSGLAIGTLDFNDAAYRETALARTAAYFTRISPDEIMWFTLQEEAEGLDYTRLHELL
jgi:hypothetical protein